MNDGLREINRQDAKIAKSAKVLGGVDDALDATLEYCDVEVDE